MLCTVPLAALAIVGVAAAPYSNIQERAVNPYQPVPAACPATALVRPATGISSSEQTYINARKGIATTALKKFLTGTASKLKGNSSFPILTPAQYPTIGLTSSGGGLRALLIGAGVIKGLDARDEPNSALAGLYQALTYEAGLSGGAWLLSAIVANDYPTISELQSFWETSFEVNPLTPGAEPTADARITANVAAKSSAGYPVSIVDVYGRSTGYTVLDGGPSGGVQVHFSDVAAYSNFTKHTAPFPIITALGVLRDLNQCNPPLNATQYEYSPYEFGSWDNGVSAFTQMKYLGSDLSNGKPTTPGPAACTTKFDNQALVLGTSSDIFPAVTCTATGVIDLSSTLIPDTAFFEMELAAAGVTSDPNEVYARYPNPFYKYKRSSLVASDPELTLADGGLALQNNPIWPFLHRQGSFAGGAGPDILIVNDNSADTSDNFPNGTEIRTTYLEAKAQGVAARMPFIPTVHTFVSQGLNKRPTFFGCNAAATGAGANVMGIIFLSNYPWTFDSGVSTFQTTYPASETDAMIANGVAVSSYNGTAGFDACVSCFILKKASERAGKTLPPRCTKCFDKYCYN